MKPTHRSQAWPYVLGFVFSVLLTLDAYWLVTKHSFGPSGLVAAIMGLAVVQLAVQLGFFLHLGQESKPRWRLLVFLFMLLVLLILVGGSLWIMYHLNYNMSPKQINNYLKDQGAF